jgi:superfamily II DNA or RNA helicase
MYNESVDLPTVSHVVFWRSTDVAKIFLQQFGRGLRGDGLVQYWDYVGSMKNFSWIGNIYEQYKEFP